MKHNLLVVLFLLLHSLHSNGMESSMPLQMCEKNIPADIIHKGIVIAAIFGTETLTCPMRAVSCIKSLSCTCKTFNTYIEKTTFSLIKKLSTKFGYPNELVAEAFNTMSAMDILCKQAFFATLCKESYHKNHITPMHEQYIKTHKIDLNFTYNPFGETQLIKASTAYQLHCLQSGPHIVVEWLLKNNADDSIATSSHKTAPLGAIRMDPHLDENRNHKYMIEYFLDRSSFNINEIRICGKKDGAIQRTTLLLYLLDTNYWKHNRRPVLVRRLLEKGADPELKPENDEHFTYFTPLEMAHQLGDQQLIGLLEEAVAKKKTQVL